MNYVCIDAGHGSDVKGKCSPDKRFYEWKWARECAKKLEEELKKIGIGTYVVYPELIEGKGGITKRIKKVNEFCKTHKGNNIICISIHNNAAGSDGKWHNATGWSGFVAPNASNNSKRLASLLWEEANKLGLKGNRSVPLGKYWVGNYGIVRDTNCPAVLTENLFQDNKSEVDYLLTEEGLNTLVKVHVEGIKKYFGI